MRIKKSAQLALASLFSLCLAACGGSSPEDGPVGGTLTGLLSGMTVTLQNNSTDKLTLGSNTTFTFATRIASLSAFSVTVLTQPVAQTCTVTRGSGVIPTDGSTVNVGVDCVLSSSVGGTVSGLASGTSVTLNSAGTDLAVASNGQFAFVGLLSTGNTYQVSVSTQPAGQTCTVNNASGTVVDGAFAQVSVSCV